VTNANDSMSVLLAEDDDTAREQISYFLNKTFREVFAARNGSEGLELFKQHRPDLVISDIRMPVLDGIQMIQEIRLLDKDAKIIMISAYNDSVFLIKAIDIGIDGYVMKPIDTTKLQASINKCTEIIAYRRAAQVHQEEQNNLIDKLNAALTKVKLLSGFLPICASCKKIRDDKGYWQQIESYIHEHSEAEFSHGICPDCAKKIYGDYYKA
jgi:YesN/AraC family two-component response regulator